MQEIKEIIRALRCSSSTRPAGHSCDGCPYLIHEAITEEESPEAYRQLKALGASTEWDICDCDTIAHDAADALEEYAREEGGRAMNDCFWCFINGVCDCNNCANCKEYVSVNSERGMGLYEKYEADVEEALKPIAEKWKQLKKEEVKE